MAAYADPARGYHNLEHLSEVLERIDEIGCPAMDFDVDTVRLAAFFHDAVYRTQAGGTETNEEASTRWAQAALAPLLPAEQVARVARLVRATAAHEVGEGDGEAAVLMDADLAILAAPAPRYERYVAGVRREHAWVPDAQFRAGRAQVLTDLIRRPHLFHTPYARERWEAAARANVARELRALAPGAAT